MVLGARLFMSVARSVAGVVTALYLADLGFSAVEIGLLFLCVSIATAVMSTVIGLLSDRTGRKPFLVGVPLLAAAAAAAYAVTTAPVLLFVFAAAGSFGRGAGAGGGSVGPYQPAESAYVAERVPAAERASAFGRLAFVSSLGALAGGLAVTALVAGGSHLAGAAATAAYRPAFLTAAVLALIAGLAALPLAESRRDDRRGQDRSRRDRSRRGASPDAEGRDPLSPGPLTPRQRRAGWPRRSWPALWRLWLTNSVNGVAIGMTGPFVSYWLYRRYGASPALIGLLFALINLGSLASSLSAARIGRRLGTVRAIVAVRAVTGVLMVPMVLAPTFWAAGAIYFVRMLAQRVALPLRQSFTQDLAHPAERASVAALSNLPMQATMAGSQVLAGYLFDEVSLAAPFEVAAVFQCANSVLYAALFGKRATARSGLKEPVSTSAPPRGM